MNFAILLAAGSSSRFARSPEGRVDKLHSPLRDGRPVWRAAYDALVGHPRIAGVGVVSAHGSESRFDGAGAAFVVAGAQTRLGSARNGVAASPEEASILLVHDAARPVVSAALIDRVLDAAERHGAAVPVLPVTDTLKRGDEWATETVSRKGLYRAQTPQAARRDWLIAALRSSADATDEAMALEGAGYRVRLVEGDEENVKITTAADLARVVAVAAATETSTGIGYDIHAFSDDAGRQLKLGGVHIPGARGLAGHSDADVVLHAIADALLGAAGLGDIGQHFPDSEARWANADSRLLLREALRMVRAAGAWPVSADVTILLEGPKIAPLREQMRCALAQELGLEAAKVNVKATTAEGLGAIGRGEGIAALAVASVQRPVE